MLDQLLLASMLQASPAVAVSKPDPGAELARCAAIESMAERLRCYDTLAGRPTVPAMGDGVAVEEAPGALAAATAGESCPPLPDLLVPAERWDFMAKRPIFKLTPHRPNYILPLSYNGSQNRDTWEQLEPDKSVDAMEVKFQLSAQIKVWDDMYQGNGDLWFAYTQVSFWQMYNSDSSAPFRETNYEPEAYLSWATGYPILGLTNRFVRLGFVHQSNGRGEPLSRSWNRVYAVFGLEKGDFALQVKPWYRVPEDDDEDDNPDIHNYLGYGEVNAYYKWGEFLLHAQWRNNLDPDDNRGAIQLDWAFPLHQGFKGYIQYFSGYGESLLDYNDATNRISLGVMLADWL